MVIAPPSDIQQLESPASSGPESATDGATRNQVMDALLDAARIRGGTRMFPDDVDPRSISDDDIKLLCHNVTVFCQQHKLSRKDLARAIGYSPSVVSEVLNGKYAADSREILIDLDRWLEGEKRRLDNPLDRPFVWTTVAREIDGVAKLVTRLRKIGLVYGPDTAGLGKTMALQAIHRETPGSILITCDTVAANPTGLLRAIAYGMRIGIRHKMSAVFDDIVDRLRDTPRLLLVDQVHSLLVKSDRPLFVLADLWNKTQSPQLWCGTNDMIAACNRIKARGLNENMSQIRSRIAYARDLTARARPEGDGGLGEPLYTIEDIRRVFAANKIRITPEAIQMLYRMACLRDSGGLRTVCNLVDVATITAEIKDLKAIDVPLLCAALQDSSQPEAFRATLRELRSGGIQVPKRFAAYA